MTCPRHAASEESRIYPTSSAETTARGAPFFRAFPMLAWVTRKARHLSGHEDRVSRLRRKTLPRMSPCLFREPRRDDYRQFTSRMTGARYGRPDAVTRHRLGGSQQVAEEDYASTYGRGGVEISETVPGASSSSRDREIDER
ncbi:hypothetical protein THAOC_00196 [Thalassiosira oceanica]|uniref:Uncharacterized protein n=1 Tax=Thalassiosira oceanica TaxID=159749 RepID=K0TPH2_THAOC|nr:hypothetical protein THAOC_00196 [Thalassiosira oceanica]|eukprot:EJK77936.1 hypothetical protein THAOC_00196 [Thalassiosira oceanica]